MKTLALMIMLTLFLSACSSSGKDAQELALKIRAEYISAAKITMTLNIAADYSDRVYNFKCKYTGNASAGEIEVKAPEAIAGLRATVTVSDATLHYDGADLYTGQLTPDGLSPINSIPVMLSQWQNGYITDSIFEKISGRDALAVKTAVSDTVTQKVWFDVKTHLPVRSEFFFDGKMVLACDFEDMIVE